MRNVYYNFSSVHINLPETLSKEIIAWGKEKISDNDIFVSQNEPSFGREDEIHTTILYGIHSEKAEKVRKIIEQEKPILVKLKKIEVFINNPKFDVVVIDVVSDDLSRINQLLSKDIPYTNNYGKYKPHVTIAYVKKDKGWNYRGINKWDGIDFCMDYATFSSKNGIKEKIFFNK